MFIVQMDSHENRNFKAWLWGGLGMLKKISGKVLANYNCLSAAKIKQSAIPAHY